MWTSSWAINGLLTMGKVEGEDTATLKEFETVKIMATFKASPYAYTKKWFLEKYKDFAREAEQGEAPSANAELAVVA